MTDEKPRRSRHAWPEKPAPPREVTPAHSHRQPRLPWAITYACLALIVVAVSLLTFYMVRFNEYVEGRGQYRDAEAARQQEEYAELNRQTACALLDGLPQGPLLDPLRERFGCGPGIPIGDLPAEAQANLRDYADRLPLTTDNDPAREDRLASPNPRIPSATLTPAAPPRTPASPADPTPSPSPSAPPLVDLNPITDPVCTALGICT